MIYEQEFYPADFEGVIVNRFIKDQPIVGVERLTYLQRKWGKVKIPKEKLDETIKQHIDGRIEEILSVPLIKFDIFITCISYVFSLFLIVFGFIINGMLISIIGLFIFIPTTIHSIDGIYRRWSKENLMKRK